MPCNFVLDPAGLQPSWFSHLKSHLTEIQSSKDLWELPCPPPRFIEEESEAQRGDGTARSPSFTVKEEMGLKEEMGPGPRALDLQSHASQARSQGEAACTGETGREGGASSEVPGSAWL